MLALSSIIEILKSNNTAYWRLFIRIGFEPRPRLIASFMQESEKRKREEEPTGETEREASNIMAQSVEQLTKQVQLHSQTPNIVFLLEYRPAPKSSDIRGPVEFVLDTSAIPAPSPAPQNTFPGMGSLDFGSHLETRLELERERSKIELDRRDFEHEKKLHFSDLARERKDLDKERDSLKELEKEYTSDSHRAKNGFNMAFRGLLDKFIPAEEGKGLQGIETEIAAVPETIEEKMIQSIATMIHEKFANHEDIQVIGIMIQHFAENPALMEAYRQRILTNQL